MRWVFSVLCVAPAILASAFAEDVFPLRDGDRVAFIGNTFIERDQDDGYIELALTQSAPDKDIVFRNLGWSGDDVTARARRFFGKGTEGFQHLMEHLDLVQPTVILVSYGTNEAFSGPAGRDNFVTGYRQLLDELSKRTQRIAIVTSPPLNPSQSPAPQVAEQVNTELAARIDLLKSLAQERDALLIDCFTPMHAVMNETDNHAKGDPQTWTTNGIHLTPEGYRLAAESISAGTTGKLPSTSDLQGALGNQKPTPATEALRQAIIKKNETFFHRHRPQNETYLRGFRKHEQGNNAHEIYEFEPLTEQADQHIFEARQKAAQQ